jgi:hypothetical protein
VLSCAPCVEGGKKRRSGGCDASGMRATVTYSQRAARERRGLGTTTKEAGSSRA